MEEKVLVEALFAGKFVRSEIVLGWKFFRTENFAVRNKIQLKNVSAEKTASVSAKTEAKGGLRGGWEPPLGPLAKYSDGPLHIFSDKIRKEARLIVSC